MPKLFSIIILLSLALAASAEQKTVDQLKAEAEHASATSKAGFTLKSRTNWSPSRTSNLLMANP